MARKANVKRPHAVATQAPEDDTMQAAEMPFAEGAHDELDPQLRHRLISDAAYALYCKRGYVDGYDLDDWLEAEAEVDHTLLRPAASIPDAGSMR